MSNIITHGVWKFPQVQRNMFCGRHFIMELQCVLRIHTWGVKSPTSVDESVLFIFHFLII